ncbi:MAG: GNAT family N-acetyltransferase [Oscillospiraceae bacterium]
MIRKIIPSDRGEYIKMAEDFYSSDAVCHRIPSSNFESTFTELMRSQVYAEAYVFEYRDKIAGYALLAKTFSQEAGGMVVWIEELYVKPEFRGHGLGQEFFEYLKDHLPKNTKRLRLEVTKGNQRAASFYRQLGFQDLPYCQMFLDV